ncbi:MAG TPA: LLM class flavin-dependent oxidoreductase, partial [Polyangia bacterium]
QIPGLTFVPTLQPGVSTPVYVAKMSVSYQRLSGRRLGWALELEGDPAVRRAHGDFLTGDDWFARADEWVVAARGVWHHDDWSFEGRHYAVEAGGFEIPLAGQQFPEPTTAGSSAAALAFAARHADVHLLSSPERVTLTDEAARLQKAAGETGRTVAAGLRLAVIARATEDEAKRDFERALLEVSPGKRGEPARPIEAHLWAGFDRSAGSHALVGSYEAVAAKLNELAAQGIHRFVLSGRPHLEEAYRFAERVAPRLQGWGIAARVPTIPTTHVTPAQVPAGAAV